MLGVVTGLWLAVYTFFGTVLPVVLLGRPGVMVIIWLGLLARHRESVLIPAEVA
ncbi:hypothetical protein [Actinophytocola oryzae]|uniref:Uncharacterized protein n=1 Tax=Actinophytocola oryzae TaxID=502181 RepID=A0A4R7UY96_9PSEU|nr:hypothetical protein [Actinophytocola oryzae]TDV41107.1 hypothetical protein CLV71_121173 [Actinophytocola oryzae]